MFLFVQTILFSFLLIGIQTANVDVLLRNDISRESRIVGGKDATNIAIPWQVSLVYYGAHHCGGSILNENTIITAAHCIYSLNKRFVKIRVGSKYRSKGGKLYTVKGWKAHEKFSFQHMRYDVAVIFLNEKIEFVKNIIEPIKLAEHGSKISHGTDGMISGWGLLSPHGGVPEMLQYAIVPVWSNEICEKIYSKNLHESMICAGFWKGGIDACQQDSGGPLVSNNILVGVVSWGDGCAKPEKPGVYSNISALREWINMALISNN